MLSGDLKADIRSIAFSHAVANHLRTLRGGSLKTHDILTALYRRSYTPAEYRAASTVLEGMVKTRELRRGPDGSRGARTYCR